MYQRILCLEMEMERRRWDLLWLSCLRVEEVSVGILEVLAEMAWELLEMLRGDGWWRRVGECCVLKVYSSVSWKPQMSVQFDGIVVERCDGMWRKGNLKSFWRVVVLRVQVEALFGNWYKA